MFSKKIYFLIIFLASFSLLGASCITFSATGVDGGIFKSVDKGATWLSKVAVPTVSATKQTIAGVNVNMIAQDPQDSNAVYIGTQANGIYFSYDGGESWQQPKQLSLGNIKDIAVDPKNKCVIYAATANKIFKSEDCSRFWKNIYFETRPEVSITSLVINPANNSMLYAGVSSGEIIRSADYGTSWGIINRFQSGVVKIIMDNHNQKVLYVATKSNGLFKTNDGGNIWLDLNKGLEQYAGSKEYGDLELDRSQMDTLILASRYGLLKSTDGGTTWDALKLLTPPGGVIIYSLALNPQNGQEMYYGTASTLYRSINGGKDWVTKKLPTSRAATVLLVDYKNRNIVYMGATQLQQ